MSEHRNISAPPHSEAQGPSFPFAKCEFKDTCHFTLGHKDLFPSITSFQLNAIIHVCMHLFNYHVCAGELRSLGASMFLDTVVTIAEGSPRTRGMTGNMTYSWCLTLAKTSQLLRNPFQNVWKFPSKLPIAALPNRHCPQIHSSTPPPSLEINQHMWSSSPSFRFCYPPIPTLAHLGGQRSTRVRSGPWPAPRQALGWERVWLPTTGREISFLKLKQLKLYPGTPSAQPGKSLAQPCLRSGLERVTFGTHSTPSWHHQPQTLEPTNIICC